MKKAYFLMTLLVMSIFAVSLAAAFWPFTGNAVTGNAVAAKTCTETDSGNDIYNAGTTTYTYKGAEKIRSDECYSSTKLTEWYCTASHNIISKTVRCPAGCQDASCIRIEPICTNLDNGAKNDSGTFTNKCDGNNLITYACEDSGSAVIPTTSVCDYQCKTAACVQRPFTCTDSDGGKIFNVSGTARMTFTGTTNTDSKKDVCNGKVLKEAVCTDTGVSYVTVNCKSLCSTDTNGGFCDPKPLSCIDDDGEDTSINSSATSTDVYGKATTFYDKCDGTKKVREAYCDGNVAKSKTINCGDMCQNGACLVRDDMCIDSDGGYKIGIKGNVISYKADGSVRANVSDFCADTYVLAEVGCAKKTSKGWNFAGNSKTSARISVKYTKCPNGNGCQAGGYCPGTMALGSDPTPDGSE
jgi:hypothetical protein